MNNDSGEPPSQAFRDPSILKVINIPAVTDPKTGRPIILWRDIQAVFKNADSIRNGESLVSFMIDENLEQAIPLRIAYHPGVVLDVLMETTTEQTISIGEAVRLSQIHSAGKEESKGHVDRLNQTVSTSAIADNTTDQSPKTIPEASQSSSMLTHNTLHNDSLNTIMSGQAIMNQNFELLKDEITKNKELQHQLQELQQQTSQQLLKKQEEILQVHQHNSQELLKKQNELQQLQEKQQHTSQQLLRKQDELLTKQEEMKQMQQRALERLINLHTSVQAVLTQTYELHEYPIPRLFVVLPKTVGFRDKFKSFLSDQFRLYFLCECGTHTMTEDSKIQHEIHLAKHEGYDLEQPTKFFERYGSYVLTLMNMIKYGVVVAGLVVPPLTSLKIVEGLDSAQKHFEDVMKNIAPLVNDAINFLQDIKSNNEDGTELATETTEFDQLEALEGADLRQLESYLKIKDQGRVLGNLYRIVTPEGHVKWVCLDHFKASYRESAIRQFRDIVQVNGGRFIEEKGRVEIKMSSNILAKQFYDAMIKARGVQELDITLEWDATMDDFRALSKAVTKANVIDLTIVGIHFKSPVLDVVNRGRRYDPILQLASNSRVQSLRLEGFDDFFTRISKSSLISAPKFRVFSMDLKATVKDKVFKSLNRFLGHCSSLATLEVRLDQEYPITMVASNILSKTHMIESLKISRGELFISAVVSNGMIDTVELAIEQLDDLHSNDLKFIKKDNLKRLTIYHNPLEADKLADLLRLTPVLSHLQIGYKDERRFSAPIVGIEVQDIIKMTAPETLSKFESLSIDYKRLSLTASFYQGQIQEMTIKIGRVDDLRFDDISFIQRSDFTQLVIEHTHKADDDRLGVILRHSPVLSYLHISRLEGPCLVKATTLDMKLQDIVNPITAETLDRNQSFFLNCRRLTLTASLSQGETQGMTMTIARLGDLTSDDLIFIRQGQITWMVIETIPRDSDGYHLDDILRHSPALRQFHIGFKVDHGLTIDTVPELKLQDLVKKATADSLSNLESLSIGYGRFTLTGKISQGKTQNMTMPIERLGSLTSDDLRQCQITWMAIETIPQESDVSRVADILRHGPILQQFHIRFMEERDLTIITTPELKPQDLVKMTTADSLSKLES
ncbi:hypothetical protein BGZ65_003189, partial [Modicella reniformis]